MKKIGILGGTFDPVHNGHVELAEAALAETGMDRIVFLPAYRQPFKKEKIITDSDHRLKMLDIIIRDRDCFGLDLTEVNHKSISYTYDTLTEILPSYRGSRLYFILGSDALIHMEDWYKGRELLRNFSFISVFRPGRDKEQFYMKLSEFENVYNADIKVMYSDMPDISSTYIRNRIKEGRDVSGLVAPEILEYINEHRLYL